MAGKFPRDAANALLAACHRRCCVCHRFCGSKIELDHMDPGYEGGADDIENAIPVCFDCHAEIHAYNDKHPRGRKYQASELRLHKEQWLAICKNNPTVFDGAAGRAPAGPLEAMANELEFNVFVGSTQAALVSGFLCEQFKRATSIGGLALLDEKTKKAVFEGYSAILCFNSRMNDEEKRVKPPDTKLRGVRGHAALGAQRELQAQEAVFAADYGGTVRRIELAYKELIAFLCLSGENSETEASST